MEITTIKAQVRKTVNLLCDYVIMQFRGLKPSCMVQHFITLHSGYVYMGPVPKGWGPIIGPGLPSDYTGPFCIWSGKDPNGSKMGAAFSKVQAQFQIRSVPVPKRPSVNTHIGSKWLRVNRRRSGPIPFRNSSGNVLRAKNFVKRGKKENVPVKNPRSSGDEKQQQT